MNRLLEFLARRRFNFVDGVAISVTTSLYFDGVSPIILLALVIVVGYVSDLLEGYFG